MNRKDRNKAKTSCYKTIFKSVAMLMSISYVFAPLNNQLSSFLHTISHSIEMPSSVLSHDSNKTFENGYHLSHSHESSFKNHNHDILQIIDTITEASNESETPDKKGNQEIKYKKHFSTEETLLPPNLTTKTILKFYSVSKALSLIHLQKLKDPPQLVKET